jgi:hypothetical protein
MSQLEAKKLSNIFTPRLLISEFSSESSNLNEISGHYSNLTSIKGKNDNKLCSFIGLVNENPKSVFSISQSETRLPLL